MHNTEITIPVLTSELIKIHTPVVPNLSPARLEKTLNILKVFFKKIFITHLYSIIPVKVALKP